MPRDIPVANGNLLITFDKDYLLRDVYFPHIGQENHAGHDPFRFGVWVDGEFSWLPEGWEISRDYLDDSLVTRVLLVNRKLNLKITVNDLVDFHLNVFMRKFTVENLSEKVRDVRLFLCHDFYIYGNDIGDTAAYRPEASGVVHYKNERYFLANIYANNKFGVDDFATGKKKHGKYEGTWKDAEDGELSNNPIDQGSVDSVVGIRLGLAAGASDECYYWMSAGRDFKEVEAIDKVVRKKGPWTIVKRTLDYWNLWVNKEDFDYGLLPDALARLLKRSLLIARTQIDNCGSIIAANDSDVVLYNRDTYSYMWPRDGALVAYALDLAGYSEVTRRFFDFCGKIIEKDGYFLHKYNPSGNLASSWHPWMKDDAPQLPIQEDETALVIWALWKHYEAFRDIEFIKPLYKPLIKSAGNMMLNYRDAGTGLPLPSYDLWEERQGILTFTVATVHGGLTAAASFARAFGEEKLADDYTRGAREVREAMDRYLYLDKEKRFARMISLEDGKPAKIDKTVDASLFGIFAFGAYPVEDERVRSTMEQVYDKLWCKTEVGGLARYEGDMYHRVSNDVPGNPWFVTTLWLAEYYVALARSAEDLEKVLEIMHWVADRALPSGVLAEQINPFTNEPLSVSPLTWSHATFCIVAHKYMNKLVELEKCEACGRSKYSKKRGPVPG